MQLTPTRTFISTPNLCGGLTTGWLCTLVALEPYSGLIVVTECHRPHSRQVSVPDLTVL